MSTTIVAVGGCSIDLSGNVKWAKNADLPIRPASTLKFLTGYIACGMGLDLDAVMCEAIEADRVGGTSASLRAGDVMTLRDMLYGLMLVSGNDAAHCIGRTIGQIVLDQEEATGDPLTRFLNLMSETVAGWGWPATEFGSPSGFPDDITYITPKQLCDIVRHSVNDNNEIVDIAGTRTHTSAVVAGAPRSITYNNTFELEGVVSFPEYISGKPGWLNGHGTLVQYWQDPDGGKHITCVMDEPTHDQRFIDMRRVMNAVLYKTSDGANLTISGRTPLGALVGGKQVTSIVLGTTTGQKTVWARL